MSARGAGTESHPVTQECHDAAPEAAARPRGAMRFALVCAGGRLRRWQADCVRALERSGEAELVAVFSAKPPPPPGGILHRAYDAALRSGCAALDWIDLAGGTAGLFRRNLLPRNAGDASAIGGIDFVLSFSGAEAADALQPAHGTWQVRFGDAGPESGELPGLRETAFRMRSVTVVVTVSRPGERTQILHRAVLKTRRSHRRTAEALLGAAPSLCLGACRRVRAGLPPAGEPAPLPVLPPAGPIRAAVAQARRVAEGAFTRLFVREWWSIGITNLPAGALHGAAPLPQPRWLDVPRAGRFHADPFPLIAGGRLYLLFEMYDARQGRGWIAASGLDTNGTSAVTDAQAAIDLGCHMSYPMVFSFRGETYCAPEVSAKGGLLLFRMGRTPWEWLPAGSALEGTPLVDPTLFEHEGRWWLFATIEGPAVDTDLHAWYAETPFGPWTAHPLNPIRSDVRAARPAGAVFRTSDGLYRPSQDCTEHYGQAVVVNRILRLDTHVFEEVSATRLEPGRDWPYPAGLHTLNVVGDIAVIDAKRRIVDLLAPFRPLVARLRSPKIALDTSSHTKAKAVPDG